MIFLGNGEHSQDVVNDRVVKFLEIINELGGLQQGLNSKKVVNKYNRRAKKFARQIKFDLLTNKVGDFKLHYSPEYLVKVRSAFEQLHTSLREAADEVANKQDQESDAPF